MSSEPGTRRLSPRRKWVVLVIVLAAALGAGWASVDSLVSRLGGDFRGPPTAIDELSPAAKRLLDEAYEGVDTATLFDYHTHVAGLGAEGTGAAVNPEMTSWLNPVKRAKFAIYLSASGVHDLNRADRQFVERFLALVEAQPHPGRHAVMAFDRYYRPDGTVDAHKTEFYVPNEYVFELAASHPNVITPVISVHPYRKDALEALRRWAGEGGRFVKWLPNAMGMTPDDPALDTYYDAMRELDLVLIAHAGEEQAVDAAEDQERGNPLRYRRPLDRGVKVVIAHCGSLGTSEDLDAEGNPQVDNFELFLRLMDDSKYEGLLFADISAMLQWNRLGEPLTTMLRRTDLHHRLVNGSDYPLPAINSLVSTWELARQGYITEDEREALNEIYAYNPLLFDFVTKRTIRAPETGEQFAATVFERHPELGPQAP